MPDRTSASLSPPSLSSATPVAARPPVISRPPLLRPPTLWSVLPSCFFFALAAAYQNSALPPLPQSAASTLVRSEQMLPLSQTMIVTSTKTSGSVLLRGTIEASGRTVVGQAPVGGQVSRVWVRNGQRVDVGERILEISSGSSTRAAPAAERGQSAAEAAQIAAVTRQQQLEAKMRDAQAQFREAELRVEAANRKVTEARALVARLQRGEAVPLPEDEDSPSNRDEQSASASSRPMRPARREGAVRRAAGGRTDNAAQTKVAAERKRAIQEVLEAQRAAESLQSKAKNAFYAASAAENLTRLKKAKVESAQAEARKTQEKFDAGQADATAIEAARTALAEAESDAAEASTKATAAREEAGRLQAQAAEAKVQSDKATQRAAQALQKLQLFANAPDSAETSADAVTPEATVAPTIAPTNSPLRRDNSRKFLSPETAVSLVRAAIRESDAAAKAATRLKEQAENYSRQVNSTKNRLESSSQQLAQAQQKVLDSTIPANLSSVRSPASGVVTSIAGVAQEVSSGEGIVSISRSNRMEVVFRDMTGIWRHLRKGMSLPAAVLLNKVPGSAARSSRIKTGVALTQYPAFQGLPSVAMTILLRDIEQPSNAGQSTLGAGAKPSQPVTVRGVIDHAGIARVPGARLRAGQSVLCSVAKPGTRETILVPAEAIVSGADGQPMIAVLTPLPVDERATANTSTANISITSPAGESAPKSSALATAESGASPSVAANTIGRSYAIKWRRVVVGTGDGIQQEVRSGLKSGERIALPAASLHQTEALQRSGSVLILTQS